MHASSETSCTLNKAGIDRIITVLNVYTKCNLHTLKHRLRVTLSVYYNTATCNAMFAHQLHHYVIIGLVTSLQTTHDATKTNTLNDIIL
jgi:hypothetical protein